MSKADLSEKHPSFGQLRISRVSAGGPVTFYGSALQYEQFIELEIVESDMYRNEGSEVERYQGGKNIVRVRMTPIQFTEMLTSLNAGDGVPVTIIRREGKAVEAPKTTNRRKRAETALHEKGQEALTALRTAQVAMAKLSAPGAKVTKQELAAAAEQVVKALRILESNLPYVVDQFEESMAKIVLEGKVALEAAFQNMQLGAGIPTPPLIE